MSLLSNIFIINLQTIRKPHMFIKALHNFLVSTEKIKYLLNGNLYYYKPNCYLKAHQQISGKWCFFFVFFFSLSGFFSRISWFTGQQGKGEAVSLTALYYFHPLYRRLDISQVIAAKSSPLRIAGSQTQTRNIWFPIGSR